MQVNEAEPFDVFMPKHLISIFSSDMQQDPVPEHEPELTHQLTSSNPPSNQSELAFVCLIAKWPQQNNKNTKKQHKIMSAPIVARHMQLQFYTHITPTDHAPKWHALTIIAYFAYKLLAAPPPQTNDVHLEE